MFRGKTSGPVFVPLSIVLNVFLFEAFIYVFYLKKFKVLGPLPPDQMEMFHNNPRFKGLKVSIA